MHGSGRPVTTPSIASTRFSARWDSACSTTKLPTAGFAKSALDQWFSQAETPSDEPMPVREGRRNHQIALVVEPLRGRLSDADVERLAHALGVIVGTDAMLALTDGVGLDVVEHKVCAPRRGPLARRRRAGRAPTGLIMPAMSRVHGVLCRSRPWRRSP